ncbi:MAG: hypothetical protein RIG26_14870 [Thalassospira sp.]|uniref:hypothetical protein n=1 Tax=Thalassospira sp. TaxID=1912094 RepID=UPI0032EB3E84
MAYGDYSGPDKPNKGQEGGACNRQLCQHEPANWFNHGSRSWYCDTCRHQIEFDAFNYRDWQANHEPDCGHPMFETRHMMDARSLDYVFDGQTSTSTEPQSTQVDRLMADMIAQNSALDASLNRSIKSGMFDQFIEDNGIEIRAIADDDLETARLFRPGNCLRASNPRVVVCHCAECGGK